MRRFRYGIQGGLPPFRLLAGGDIARHADTQVQRIDAARRPHDIHQAAVLAPVTVFEADPLDAGLHPGGLFARARAILLGNEVEEVPALELFGLVAEQLPATGTDVHHDPGSVDQEDDVEKKVGDV